MRNAITMAGLLLFASACQKDPAPTSAASGSAVPVGVSTIHQVSVKDITGKEVALSTYKGKVLLVVNVASQCGFTPQYTGLEALHERYQSRGFAVLGFPSNDFGGQEPGTEAEIAAFGKDKYGVMFPMFSKVSTKGDTAAPLYKFLTAKHAAPKWNFYKYLVGKDGLVIDSYASTTKPDSAELASAIEAALAAK